MTLSTPVRGDSSSMISSAVQISGFLSAISCTNPHTAFSWMTTITQRDGQEVSLLSKIRLVPKALAAPLATAVGTTFAQMFRPQPEYHRSTYYLRIEYT